MRRTILTASLLASLAVPASAPAADLAEKYASRHHRVEKQHKRHPAAIPRAGAYVLHKRSRPVVRASAQRMLRWLRQLRQPAAAPTSVTAAAPAVPTTPGPSYQGGGGGGLPACADESAGNYSTGSANTNPSSGATGRWQTLRSHYDSGGICDEFDLSPGGQDACAHKIYAEQGSGAWVNC